MTELVQHQPNDLAADMHYAEVISGGAMLPTQYRGKPADILIAMGLGRAMGLSPAESLYRIHVIQGRPTASAELIAANVRKAGHILRVRGDETSARAVIIRSDDPEFEFESVWNLERAKRLGLAGKDGWQKQPGTMMRWRAITEVARLACPEALYGVAYVADEISDAPRESFASPTVTASDFLNPAADAVQTPLADDDVQDSEEVADEPETGEAITDAQMKALHASFGDVGIKDRDIRLDYVQKIVGRELTTSSDLTRAEASRVIDALKQDADAAQREG